MADFNLLIIDDEASMRSALRRALRHRNHQISTASDGVEALAVFDQHPINTFAIAIVDLCMPGMDGLELLTEIKRRSPRTQVLILTGKGTIGDAVRAMRLGADDFLEKPFDPDALRERIRTAQRVWLARRASLAAHGETSLQDVSQNLVGESEKMEGVRSSAWQMSDSEATLLIQGESGTGKDKFARAVHYGGRRTAEPFVSIDTSAINSAVIESELFGHCKGAFTGADSAREGLLRAARKGTIFLDEIGDLPLNMQTKLLRVLQEREVRPVGSEETFPIEARFIAATNRNLLKAVSQGEFREDLFHRLNVLSITMPSLRERKEDIPILAHHFVMKFIKERPTVQGLADAACATLMAYDWPGNVRELENAILRAVVIGRSELIEIADLPSHVTIPSKEASGFSSHESTRTRPSGSDTTPANRSRAAGTLVSYEREAILAALAESDGNRERAANVLNIGVATLYRKLKRYDIR